MNTLSYGLLALLAASPRTGYELMQRIQPFWRAKHSQIYPLLAKLEQSGCVSFVPVPQKEKPDKKIYSITDSGLALLKQWLPEPACEPVKRDEFLLKTYCVSLTDRIEARRLIEERTALFEAKLDKFNRMLSELLEENGGGEDEPGFGSPAFGHYVLLKRAIGDARAELEWCDWIFGLLNRTDKPDGSG